MEIFSPVYNYPDVRCYYILYSSDRECYLNSGNFYQNIGSKQMEDRKLKEEIILKDKIKLLEKEIGTLTDKLEEALKSLKEFEDLKHEIKGLKLFITRMHPEFKIRYPEIMHKVYKKR